MSSAAPQLIKKEGTERSELSHSIKKKTGMAKKIKAPIPLFKNLHERRARWASLFLFYESLTITIRYLIVLLDAAMPPKSFFLFFFGYERLPSFRGVREFRGAPVDRKRNKKI